MLDLSRIRMERILAGNYSRSLKNKDNRNNFRFRIEGKHIIRTNWLLFFMIITIVAYMFHLKSNVQDLNSEYRLITSQIEDEHRQYNLLKAELAYLNSPHRLQVLASKYLQLNNVKPEQFVMETKENGALAPAKFLELSNKATNHKWKYKNSSNHLKTASYKPKKGRR